jgi:fructose-bisphosphate aldolase class I
VELAFIAQRSPCWCADLGMLRPGPAALQWAPSRGLQHALRRLDRGEPAQGRASPLALHRGGVLALRGREHVPRLRPAARLVVVALARGQLFLHQLCHHQRRIEVLVLDIGAKQLALHTGEKVTEGLDGLRERLAANAGMGARLAKWRAVIGLDGDHPSAACIAANMQALARYAALCQEAGIVPIVEPEVLMTGTHTLDRCQTVTGKVLTALFDELHVQGVLLEGVILKPNMVLPGLDCPAQEPVSTVAAATIDCLLRHVPPAIAGIAFLSGGQSAVLASARLNAMNDGAMNDLTPWPLVFSFARAIQQPALDLWRGLDANVEAAQAALIHRARCNHAALRGAYDAGAEAEGDFSYRKGS